MATKAEMVRILKQVKKWCNPEIARKGICLYMILVYCIGTYKLLKREGTFLMTMGVLGKYMS